MKKAIKLVFICCATFQSYCADRGCVSRFQQWWHKKSATQAAHRSHDLNNGILLPNSSNPFPAPVTRIVLDYLKVTPTLRWIHTNDPSDTIESIGFMDCRDNFHLLAGYASPVIHAQRGTLTRLKQDELRALYSGLQQKQKASFLFPGREELDLQEDVRSCWSRVCQKKLALSLAIKRDLMEFSRREEEKNKED